MLKQVGGGSLQDKTFDQVRALFDKIVANGCRSFGDKRHGQRRQAGLMEVSPTIEIDAQLATITKKMARLKEMSRCQKEHPSCGI